MHGKYIPEVAIIFVVPVIPPSDISLGRDLVDILNKE